MNPPYRSGLPAFIVKIFRCRAAEGNSPSNRADGKTEDREVDEQKAWDVLRRLLPYGLINEENPIFQQEWRQVRWLGSPARLRRYNRMILGGIPLLTLVWWIIERVNSPSGTLPTEMENNLLIGLLCASLIGMVVSNIYGVLQTTSHLHKQLSAGNWDVLKLTAQYQSEILMTEDAVNQLRLWPLIAVEVGLRSATLLLLTANSIYGLSQRASQPSAYSSQAFFNVVCWFFWGLLLIIGLGYVIEPILRGRVIVAISTVIAIRINSLPMAVLAGLEGMLTIFLTQGLLVGSGLYLVQKVSLDRGSAVVLFCLIPVLILPLGTMGWLYLYVRGKALEWAYRWAFEG